MNVSDFDFNSTDEKGDTLFHQVCLEGSAIAVKIMLEMSKDGHININVTNKKGQYAYDLAKEKNHTEVLRLLHNHCETLNVDIYATRALNGLRNLRSIIKEDSPNGKAVKISKIP